MGLGLVLVWYTAASEVAWLFLLAAWVLALIVAAYVYAGWNAAGLIAHLKLEAVRSAAGSPAEELPDHVLRGGPQPAPLFEGDGMEVEVGLDTKGGARGPAWLEGRIGGKDISFGTGIVPRAGWRRLSVVRELRRGPVGATSWRIASSDPLGFFRFARQSPDREVALVLPRFASLRDRHEVRELEASAAAPRAGSGNELFGVREFRPGDPLRRIHWRSSARRGELVVREFEPPGVQSLGIFCDPRPTSREVADQIARVAASEAWDCIRDGGRVVLWAPGLEPTEPRHARDIWAQLEWLARYGPSDGPTPAFAPTAPASGEVVAILASADPDVLEALDDARRRGGRARAWVVGDWPGDLDVPAARIGTGWPL